VSYLHINPWHLAAEDSQTGAIGFLDEKLDQLEIYIMKIASIVPSLQLVKSDVGPQIWSIERSKGNPDTDPEVKVRVLTPDEVKGLEKSMCQFPRTCM
jgi:hypothetical protein